MAIDTRGSRYGYNREMEVEVVRGSRYGYNHEEEGILMRTGLVQKLGA
jgi:hypothetical protein